MSLDPIVRTLQVRLAPDAAFDLFTSGMEGWWPLDTHSRIEPGQTRDSLVVEPRTGGRIFERMSDGAECDWGRFTAFEPGRRLAIDWKPNDEDRPPTEVEVTFLAAADGGTTVRLEHRGWELLGPVLGMEARSAYDAPEGWGLVFDRAFAEAAGVVR